MEIIPRWEPTHKIDNENKSKIKTKKKKRKYEQEEELLSKILEKAKKKEEKREKDKKKRRRDDNVHKFSSSKEDIESDTHSEIRKKKKKKHKTTHIPKTVKQKKKKKKGKKKKKEKNEETMISDDEKEKEEESSSSSFLDSSHIRKISVNSNNEGMEEELDNVTESLKLSENKKVTQDTVTSSVIIEERELKPNEWLIDPKNKLKVVDIKGIDPIIVKNLSEQFNIDTLMPVQSTVIPPVLKTITLGGLTPGPVLLNSYTKGDSSSHFKSPFEAVGGDMCVLAPTGSGKTLAYVIPVVNSLIHRVVRRLRALIIVPTRDLVMQVAEIFRKVSTGTDLHVMELYGQKSFSKDQKKLVESSDDISSWKKTGWGFLQGGAVNPSISVQPYGIAKEAVFNSSSSSSSSTSSKSFELQSKVDILVTTPGRLVDIIKANNKTTRTVVDGNISSSMMNDNTTTTTGFTLEHLRFLVIDEADRLLQDSYQNWLHKLVITCPRLNRTNNNNNNSDKTKGKTKSSYSKYNSISPSEPIHKLLFSATLTDNPQKLAGLHLFNPKYFSYSIRTRYSIPNTLKQYHVVCPVADKLLVLHQMLLQFQKQRVLVFSASIETTHKVYLLLTSLGISSITEYSGQLSQQERSNIVNKFKEGKLKIVVASDAMARGLDIPNVDNIINFDAPLHVKTYVHRVGRSARAGKHGRAFTLLTKSQVRSFREMVRKAGAKKLYNWRWDGEKVRENIPEYKKALEKLKITLLKETKVQHGIYKPIKNEKKEK